MTNLPPEHRNPNPGNEPDPESTGSYPPDYADDNRHPPEPPSVDPEMTQPGYLEQQPGQAEFYDDGLASNPAETTYQAHNLAPTHHDLPGPSSTGQFPAFTDPTAVEPEPAFDQYAHEQFVEDYQTGPPPAPEPQQLYETGQRQEADLAPYPEPTPSFESTMESSVAFPAEPESWNEPESPPLADLDAPAPIGGLLTSQDGAAQVSGEYAPADAPDIHLPAELRDYGEGSDVDADLPARLRRKLAKQAQPDTKLKRLRAERDSDSGWTYLVLLGVLFSLLLVFSWSCGRLDDADQSAARNAQLALDVNVVVLISGDQVSVSGTLPDKDRADQLIELVAEHYEQITNNLELDDAVSADDSVVQLTGQAAPDDARPGELEATLKERFDIPVTANTVEFGALPESLVSVSVRLEGSAVQLSGTVPDQTKLDLVQSSAEAVWGADNVDGAGLVLGNAVWDGGRITVSGNILGDVRPAQFAERVRVEGVFVDVGEADGDLEKASPEQIKQAVVQTLEGTPITFAEGDTTLSEESKKTVESIAKLLLALPEGEPITIVGYGDGGVDSESLGSQRAGVVFSNITLDRPTLLEAVDFEGSAGSSTSRIIVRFDP